MEIDARPFPARGWWTCNTTATTSSSRAASSACAGDTVELCPAGREDALRVEFFGDQIERITRFEPLTGHKIEALDAVTIYPGKQFVTPGDKLQRALLAIREELGERIAWFEKHGKLLEAQRIKMRTEYDLEMMEEMGFCSGIENYSRHLGGRAPGSRPCTLFDFFPKDYLLVIDESHATVPQIGGMYEGDRSRKTVLVEYGFRLPSALDNRPLNFRGVPIACRARPFTPAPRPAAREIGMVATAGSSSRSSGPPAWWIRRSRSSRCTGQIDDLIDECRRRADAKERVLVTTLTKRTAEELTDYLREIGINVHYLHSEIDAIERVEILRALRKGEFDVLVGINLLREGLDLPEVSLVAILDADKEGFLRSETSLIQTAGRAARHLHGEVILYADVMTAEHPEVPGRLRLPAAKATGLQPGAQHHAAQRQPRRGGKPRHLCIHTRASRRGLTGCEPGCGHHGNHQGTRSGDAGRRRGAAI